MYRAVFYRQFRRNLLVRVNRLGMRMVRLITGPGVQQIDLSATTYTGLPAGYYVVSGPAVVSGHVLKFTQIPVKSKYPVKVTLTAY
jgi:hypothetical protein